MPERSVGPPEQGGSSMTTVAARPIASSFTAAEAVPGGSAGAGDHADDRRHGVTPTSAHDRDPASADDRSRCPRSASPGGWIERT
jgi:hypothetical protein